MNVAGISVEFLFGIGIIFLGALLLWAVMRNRRNPGEASVEATERATRDLYAEENRRSSAGTDKQPD